MLSEKLRLKRQQNKLTQIELARRVGITRDLYNKYERAGVRPSHETLLLLAKELNTTVDYLISEIDDDIEEASKKITGKGDFIIKDGKIIDYSDLPEEAQKELESYAQYLKQKYNLKKI